MNPFKQIDALLVKHNEVVELLKAQGSKLLTESAWTYCAKDSGRTRPGAGEIVRAQTAEEILERVQEFRTRFELKQKPKRGSA